MHTKNYKKQLKWDAATTSIVRLFVLPSFNQHEISLICIWCDVNKIILSQSIYSDRQNSIFGPASNFFIHHHHQQQWIHSVRACTDHATLTSNHALTNEWRAFWTDSFCIGLNVSERDTNNENRFIYRYKRACIGTHAHRGSTKIVHECLNQYQTNQPRVCASHVTLFCVKRAFVYTFCCVYTCSVCKEK